MKKIALGLAALAFSACAIRAQVDVEVVLDQSQFLPSEAIPVAVRVVNHSGQTLHFGTDDWLSYSIEAQDGAILVKAGDPPMDHNFDLQTSRVATQRGNLAPCFTISRTGHYTVVATVKLKDWDSQVTSSPKGFDVIQGVKLWEQEFGVPESPTTNREPPEVRKYILQKATYLKHLQLYLRVTDPSESRVFRVMPIGPMTSFSQPAIQLDQRNNLHLLYEDAARTYLYAIINPDGDLLVRQKYYYTDAAPRMKTDPDGKIYLMGGERHASPDDVPPPTDAAILNDSTSTNR